MKLLLTMLLLVGSIFAQDYVKVAETETAVFYVDKSSIVKTNELFKFTGRLETREYFTLTDFATNCKTYVVLFERAETAEQILTRKNKNLVTSDVQPGTPFELAINYVCYNTLKKDRFFRAVPETE